MKKLLSILLVFIMLFTMAPVSVFAAESTSVKLISFMRGDVSDLRSSELLEVQVEGYDGNPRELTYKWTSSLGTYLYIYNSHNMYGINNTYGEMEIYNSDKKVSRNPNVEADRSGDKTLSETGFMWASVYGAYEYSKISASEALKGTVKVEVYDKNNKKLGEDSFSSFKAHNLDADLDNVVIGLFEGDRMNALDLLGQSGIVHITCEQSKVSSAKILSGSEHIKIETEQKNHNTYNYYINGVKAGTNSTNGDAQLKINITKTACKFHYKTSGSAEPVVYVFRKPTTSTTATTLTLDKNSIDDRCEYFVDGNKGEKQPDGTILFTGLTPNTDYTVEVRAEYDDNGETKYVYGYVDDTTKPVYTATVNTYLDSVKTDISDIKGEDVTLGLRNVNSDSEYIELEKTDVGTYVGEADNGIYRPWHVEAGEHYHQAREYELIIENANGELNLHHYSVNYDANGGTFADGNEAMKEIYPSASSVTAIDSIPEREGYIFAGWDYDGNVIYSGNIITSSITAPVTLTAKWEKAVNVTINVTIDHKTADGFDPNPSRTELDVDFVEMKAGTDAFVETGDKLYFREDKTTDENGNNKAYTYSFENNVSTYTATDYTYTGLLESSTFGVALHKSGYDVGTVEKIKDENGNWTINIPLTYMPDYFDVDFSIEMADDVPTELYPDAVIVKIAYWNSDANEWKIISQHETTDVVVKPGVRVDIDPVTGEGSGSYPVWKFDGDNNPYGYRAVVTGFIYKGSTIVVPTEKDHSKENGLIEVTYTDGNYTATMGDVTDGQRFSTSLNGAYYNSATDAQQGTLDGVITIEKYDVIFDANGGKINGSNTYTEKDEYYVPDVNGYVPEFDGHEFRGWYKDPEFTQPAVSGEILTETITVYAKWDRVLTGYVRIAGSYIQDGEIVDVWAIDRADCVVILLLEITQDGAYVIDNQTVKVTWPLAGMVCGISEEYKFTGLDTEKEYRTQVLILNYETTYQNSTTSVVDDGDYSNDYNADDFDAVYPESSKWETFVNAYLTFTPASYFQPVEVDATLIGANLRPDDTLVEVIYKATGSDNEYQVISQHTVYPYGIEIGMGDDGMDDGDYGYMVWNSVYDGTLYDYQANLTKLEGSDVSQWPVTVVYGDPSRYSPLHDAPTGVLQVKLLPNRYDITFNEMYEAENMNVVSYGIHTWSYETVIDYVPVRDGYVFEGWYTNSACTGEKVTAIAETVAQDTELYAKWEKRSDLELTVNHVDKATNEALETETKTGLVFGDVISAETLVKDFAGYSYDSASAENVTVTTGKNEITLYYTVNSYEYVVNYLEEGTDKQLAASKYGIAEYKQTVTEGAVAVFGYKVSGSATKSIVIDTENNVINFYYTKKNNISMTVSYVEKETGKKLISDRTVNNLTYGDAVSASAYIQDIRGYNFVEASADEIIVNMSSNAITLYYEKASYGYTVEYYYDNVLDASKTEYASAPYKSVVNSYPQKGDGYILLTVANLPLTISDDEAANVIRIYYYTDNVGGGKYGTNYDGNPDIYQKKIVFRVVNGTWADGTSNSIVKYVNLKLNGSWDVNGTASLEAPSGMIASEGFANGSWDVTPPSTVKGTATETYTFTFKAEDGSDTPVTPEIPEIPSIPEIPGVGMHVVFGKTEGIGWYRVSRDGGETYEVVFGNSTLEVEYGDELIISVDDLPLDFDAYAFYVNEKYTEADEEGKITVTVDGYMLIRAVGYTKLPVPDTDNSNSAENKNEEESLSWIQKFFKAIREFFEKLFGIK